MANCLTVKICRAIENTEQSTSVTEIVMLKNLPVSTWVRVQVYSSDTNFLYEQSILSRMTDAFIYSLKLVLEPRTLLSAVEIPRPLGHSVLNFFSIMYKNIADQVFESSRIHLTAI